MADSVVGTVEHEEEESSEESEEPPPCEWEPEITLADLEPILVTLLKVLGVMFVLSTGNLLFYGAAFYLYRQHKKRAAHEEKLAKQKSITGEAPPTEAAD